MAFYIERREGIVYEGLTWYKGRIVVDSFPVGDPNSEPPQVANSPMVSLSGQLDIRWRNGPVLEEFRVERAQCSIISLRSCKNQRIHRIEQ